MLEYSQFLGMYWGEPGLQPFIDELKITKPPKIKKGETDTYITLKKVGIELAFTDERYLNLSNKVVPEGVAILSNIRFYFSRDTGFQPYSGKLPQKISLPLTKKNALEAFGIPNFPKYSATGQLLRGKDDWKMRWDNKNYIVFCTFNDENTAKNISLQLPPC